MLIFLRVLPHGLRIDFSVSTLRTCSGAQNPRNSTFSGWVWQYS